MPVAATDPLYILYTSGTTARPKGVVRDNGGHAVALRWSMDAIYDTPPGEVFWAASDVGWVVGHSYIVYAPLLAGCTTVLYEGKPVGTPDAGAFWRVVADHKVKALFTAPTAFRAIKKEDPAGALARSYDLSSLKYLFLAGERLDPETYRWAGDLLGVPVVDHWWQTETGWPIAANLMGLEPMPTKPGSPSMPVPDMTCASPAPTAPMPGRADRDIVMRLRCRRAACPPCGATTSGSPTPTCRSTRAIRHRRRRLPRHRRLPVRDGPHRRRHQRRRAPAVHRRDGRDPGQPSRGGRMRGDRRARCAQGPIPRGFVVLKAGVSDDPDTISAELVQLVRDQIGAVAALEILDSRGRPTLAVTVRLADDLTARAGVPSGASTGSREAVERRDGDPARYEGKGVLGAVSAVNTEIRDLLRGRAWASLAEADQAMIDLDGTANKSRLGANATVGTSMALARALAASAGVPLWQWVTPERCHAVAAGPALQRAQRRRARAQPAGLPGIHGRPGGRAVDGRSRPGWRGGLRRAAPRAFRPQVRQRRCSSHGPDG